MAGRLTEAQIAALRPQITEYPERRLILPAYPPPRRKRSTRIQEQANLPPDEPGALPTEGLSGLPTARLWSFFIRGATLNDTFQDASPPYAGPGLIDFLFITEGHQLGASIFEALNLSYSDVPATRNPLGTAAQSLPGTPITDRTFIDESGGLTMDPGLPFSSDVTVRQSKWDLQIYVPLPRWYLNLGYTIRIAGSRTLAGYFRIVENIAPPETV